MSAVYLCAKEVGERVGNVSSDTVLKWFHAGMIPGLKIGRKIFFDFEEVKSALERLQKRQMARKRAAGKCVEAVSL